MQDLIRMGSSADGPQETVEDVTMSRGDAAQAERSGRQSQNENRTQDPGPWSPTDPYFPPTLHLLPDHPVACATCEALISRLLDVARYANIAELLHQVRRQRMSPDVSEKKLDNKSSSRSSRTA